MRIAYESNCLMSMSADACSLMSYLAQTQREIFYNGDWREFSKTKHDWFSASTEQIMETLYMPLEKQEECLLEIVKQGHIKIKKETKTSPRMVSVL